MTKIEELRAAYEAATGGEWKPCRAHEGYEGAYFHIDPEEQAEYDACPFVSIDAPTGTVVKAHDLFELERANANFIALAHNLMPALLEAVKALEEIRKGSALEGRWLDPYGDECNSGTEGAEWVLYTDEEQAAWVISVTNIANKALEKLR